MAAVCPAFSPPDHRDMRFHPSRAIPLQSSLFLPSQNVRWGWVQDAFSIQVLHYDFEELLEIFWIEKYQQYTRMIVMYFKYSVQFSLDELSIVILIKIK